MASLVSSVIHRGRPVSVYNASQSYSEYVARETDYQYGNEFVVKMRKGQPSLWADYINKLLRIHQTIKFNSVPHVMPMLHWVAFENNTVNYDGFTTNEVISNNVKLLAMTFPKMDGKLESILSTLTLEQRVDLCYQVIAMVTGLHSVGISRLQLNSRHILYKQNDDHYYYALSGLDTAYSDTDRYVVSADYMQLGGFLEEILGFTTDYILITKSAYEALPDEHFENLALSIQEKARV